MLLLHENRELRNLVLTRFFATPKLIGKFDINVVLDTKWHTFVNVCCKSEKRWSPERKKIASNDNGMKDDLFFNHKFRPNVF